MNNFLQAKFPFYLFLWELQLIDLWVIVLATRVCDTVLHFQIPNQKIVQNWRIKRWPDEHYSVVTITIEQQNDNTTLNLVQIGVPEKWVYFVEFKFFSSRQLTLRAKNTRVYRELSLLLCSSVLYFFQPIQVWLGYDFTTLHWCSHWELNTMKTNLLTFFVK